MRVHYLATPARYRWMGITPTLPVELERAERPDVVHVFGFRDPVTTVACRLGAPARRPVRLRAARHVPGAPAEGGAQAGARLDALPRRRVGRGGGRGRVEHRARRRRAQRAWCRTTASTCAETASRSRSRLRPANRAELGIPDGAPIVLYVGRIAAGKGIEHLVAALQELPEAHLVLVGPDDRHGVAEGLGGERVHVVGPTDGPPLALYRLADVFVLPSAGESFGMVAAEAAAAGTPGRRHRPLRHRRLLPRRRGARRARPADGDPRRGAERPRRPGSSCTPRGGRRGGGAALVVGRRHRPAGGALPAGRRLAHPGQQVVDGRAVAKRLDELSRAGSHRRAKARIVGVRRARGQPHRRLRPERGSRSRRRGAGRMPRPRGPRGRAAGRRRPLRSRRRPRARGVERSAKTSPATYASTTDSSGRSPVNVARTPRSRASSLQARALGPVPDDDHGQVGAACGAQERVDALLRGQAGDGHDGDVVGSQAEALAQPRRGVPRAGRRRRRSARRRSCWRRRGPVPGAAPSATTESRASEPVTSTLAAPATTGGTTTSFTRRRQPGFGPASWLSTSRTYGTCRSRHHATAACDANVLQPETTTQSGADRVERAEDARRHGVVVAEHAAQPRHRDAVQEHGAVLQARPSTCARRRCGPRRRRSGRSRRRSRRDRGEATGTASARGRRT